MLADTLSEVKASSLFEWLGDVQAKVLVNTQSNGLAEVEDKTHGNRVRNVEAKALVHTLFNTTKEAIRCTN